MPVDTARQRELREALQKRLDENDGIASEFKIEDGGGVVVAKEKADAFRKNLAEAQEIKGLLEMETGQAELKAFGHAPLGGNGAGGSVAAAAAAAEAAAGGSGGEGSGWSFEKGRTLGEYFTKSEEFQAFRQSGRLTMDHGVEFKGENFGQMERKDIYTTYPGGPSIAPRFGQTQFDPLVPIQQRRVRVRDLFPVVTTDANLIDFFRVTGFTNNASVVPERVGSAFGLKPQSSLTFVAVQAPVRIIAHYEVAHRNVINDEPQLQGLLNNELLYGLRLEEDYQILQGTGTTEDLQGVLNTPGIQGYTHNTASVPPYNIVDNKADDIRRAATRVILAYYEPTGTVVHPYDWEAIELTKDQYGRYLVITGGVAVGAEKTLWQMPVVDTPAMPQGTFLTGAFGLGAQLYDREVGNIRIAEQHADFFLRNAVVVLAEERLALAVKRPESFVKGTF